MNMKMNKVSQLLLLCVLFGGPGCVEEPTLDTHMNRTLSGIIDPAVTDPVAPPVYDDVEEAYEDERSRAGDDEQQENLLPPPWTAGPGDVGGFNLLDYNNFNCNQDQWLGKYIKYRERLVGDGTPNNPGFVSIGTDPGQSMISSGRHPVPNEPWNSTYVFSDTLAHQGIYLAMLGSESGAFQILNADTTRTHDELYHALAAVERLDINSTQYYIDDPTLSHLNLTPGPDGFYLRNDAPDWEVTASGRPSWSYDSNGNYQKVSQFMVLPDGSPRFPGYGRLTTNPTVSRSGERRMRADSGDVMSVDQIVYLFFGLSIIIEHVDPAATVQGRNLRLMAQEIMHRTIYRILDQFVEHGDWWIRTPDGWSPTPEWGGEITFPDMLASLANHYVGGTFNYFNGNSYTQPTGPVGIPSGGWSLLWASFPFQSKINKGMFGTGSSVLSHWVYDHVDYESRLGNDSNKLAPLIRAVMQGRNLAYLDEWVYETLLTSAPCSGPCQNTAGCDNAEGWMGNFRFGNVGSVSRSGGRYDGEHRVIESPGLDYMLLHNFYILYKGADYQVQPVQRNVPTTCSSPLDNLLDFTPPSSGSWATQSYDASSDECTGLDLQKEFCGRPFASWLADASEGKATIFTPGYQWSCHGQGQCTLNPAQRYGAQGTGSADLILGSAGGDFLDGQAGNDCIYGFDGDDTLRGNSGFDQLHGGAGNDDIMGHRPGVGGADNSDIVYAGPGDDTVLTSAGDDDVYGGPGNDDLRAGDGADVIKGGDGHDYLEGWNGVDILFGGRGNDHLSGGTGDSYLGGGPGDDIIHGGSGSDYGDAGPGNDLVYTYGNVDQISVIDNPSDSDYNKIELGDGNDAVFCSYQPCEVWGGTGDDFIQGGDGRDKLSGDDGNDLLIGLGGNDFLLGRSGHDTLLSGPGHDRMCGNEGLNALDDFSLRPDYSWVPTVSSWHSPPHEDQCNLGPGFWEWQDSSFGWVYRRGWVDYSTCSFVQDNECTVQALVGW